MDTIKTLKRVDIALKFRDRIHISHDMLGINDTLNRVRYVVAMAALHYTYVLGCGTLDK